MWRLTERMVRSTFVTAWRLATSPTSTSPFLTKATTDGVVLAPSALVMTVGSPPSRTLTTELVVPRSMPTARAMSIPPADLSGTDSSMHDTCHWVNRAESSWLNLLSLPTRNPASALPLRPPEADGEPHHPQGRCPLPLRPRPRGCAPWAPHISELRPAPTRFGGRGLAPQSRSSDVGRL